MDAKQIKDITEGFLKSLETFHTEKIPHGDIQPCNVYIKKSYKQTSEVLIVDPFLFDDTQTGFSKKINQGDFYCCLSPQAMGGLMLGLAGESCFNHFKNDIWAMGICLVSLIASTNFNLFYD